MILHADGLDPLELDDWANGMTVPQVEVGGPADRAVAFDRPRADGDDDFTQHTGARVVTIGLALGVGTQTREDLLSRIAPFLHVSRRITLEDHRGWTLTVRPQPMPVSWTNPGGIDLTWSFKTVGSPYWRGEDRTVDLTPKPPPPGWSLPLTLPMTFPDPPLGQMLTAYNAGSVDADWTWTIYGPVIGPCLRNESTGDQVCLPDLELIEGQTAVVDSATRRVTVDGQNRFSLVDFATTTWWRVPVGTSVVSMPVASYSDPAVGVLAYHDVHHS